MVLHFVVRSKGFDLKVAAAPAVLSKQEPRQGVIDRSLSCGVVPIDGGGLAAKVQRQRFAPLKISEA